MSFAVARGAPLPAQQYVDGLLQAAGVPEGRGNVAKLLLHCMKANPHDVAIINADTGAEVSNAMLLARLAAVARALRAAGARRAAVVTRNSDAQVVVYHALLTANVPPLMLDYNITPVELRYFLELQEPDVVFCDEHTCACAEQAVGEWGGSDARGVRVINISDVTAAPPLSKPASSRVTAISLADFVQGFSDEWEGDKLMAEELSGEETALLTPTSGSTGLPKAACVHHRGLIAQLHNLWFEFFPCSSRTIERVLLVSTPQWLTHSSILLAAPAFRVTVVVSGRDNTTANLEHIFSTYKPEWLLCSPPVIAALAAAAGAGEALRSLRVLLAAGSQPAPELIAQLKSKLSPDAFIQHAYGSTETMGAIAVQPLHATVSCLGPISNIFNYKIVDHDGTVLTEPDQVGELCVNSECSLIKEYLKNPAATAAAFRDGWYATGDLVRVDRHGNLHYVARQKFAFKFKNYQVSPEEVEGVAGGVGGVRAVCVCLAPSGPAALLVPADPALLAPGGRREAETLKRDVAAAVAGSLSAYKHLSGGVHLVPALPLTSTGKLQRRECQLLLDDLLQRAAPDQTPHPTPA